MSSGPGGRDARASDVRVVVGQLGREARGTWSVAARCRWQRPTVIAVAPLLDDDEPFPTTLWLTCPWLSRRVDEAESAGGASRWTARVASDPAFAERALASDTLYRDLRRRLGGGTDPCPGVGIAGQADPLAVKCVHGRVAAFLGGTGDPVGEALLDDLRSAGLDAECDDDRCGVVLGGARGIHLE